MSGQDQFVRRALHRQYKRVSHTLAVRFSPTASFPDEEPVNTSPADQSPPDNSPATPPAQSTPTPPPPSAPQVSSPSIAPTSTPPAPSPSPSTPPSPPPTSLSLSPSSSLSSSLSLSSSSAPSATPSSISATSGPTSNVAVNNNTPAPASTPASISTPQSVTLPTSFRSLPETPLSLPTGSPGDTSSSASPSATPASAVNTGAIVGGIAGGIAGIAVLIFIAMFFLRRWRKRTDVDVSWNADNFRRQSAVLTEDIPVNNSPFNPRPPTMIERRLAHSPAPPFGTYAAQGQGQHPDYAYGQQAEYGAYGNYQDQSSFLPGQIMSPPHTTTSANPLFTSYGHQSPLGSPVSVAPYDSAYNDQGQLVRQQSSAAAYMSRQNSMTGTPPGTYDQGDSAHYVDLSRSSVSPYQAAQYAEISRRLNTEPPVPIAPLSALPEEPESRAFDAPEYTSQQSSMPSTPREKVPPSPFADPAPAPAYVVNEGEHNIGMATTSDEPDPAISASAPVRAPSPVRVRVDSIPPMLPEIHLQNRSFSPVSYDFPASVGKPSPLANSFNMYSPNVTGSFSEANAAIPSPVVHAPAATATPQTAVPQLRGDISTKQRPDTVYTVYDEEDAYGGF